MLKGWTKFFLILPLAFLGDEARTRVFPHDAYVWQRRWTPALDAALQAATPDIRSWRVLAAEAAGDARLTPSAPDWTVLAASGRPVIAVVRIDGQLMDQDADALIDGVVAVADAWRRAPIRLAGLEIDHDCATARLPAYIAFLGQLREKLGPLPVSITALPAWLSSPRLPELRAMADDVVLQVHAVQDPHAGLIDPVLALAWIDRFARISPRSFHVALPTYGARVAWDDDGGIAAVEAERPLLAGGAAETELMAPVTEVAALLHDLEARSPRNLAGIVWFRLPTAGDRRAWSVATWRAVMRGEVINPLLRATTRTGDTADVQDISLVNAGDLDAPLPRRVHLPAACTVADGINGYVIDHDAGALTLDRAHDRLLQGHTQTTVGWMRCPAQGELRVEP